MTNTPDEPNEPPEGGDSSGDSGARRRIDEDAAWRQIVENYGDRPSLGGAPAEPPRPEQPGPEQPGREQPAPRDQDDPPEERLKGLFRPSWDDPHQTEATWDDEGHFVPPTPPPVRVTDPRRRLAWTGLFGSPFVMLVAVVLGWRLPDWIMFGLAFGFAGGFVYLVATMPKRRPGDGSGGDGAVV